MTIQEKDKIKVKNEYNWEKVEVKPITEKIRNLPKVVWSCEKEEALKENLRKHYEKPLK